MAVTHNFRGAFNGFNREDVVHYIEYLNTKHTAQINQLRSEMDELRKAAADAAQTAAALEAEKAQLLAQADELKAQLAEAQAKPTAPDLSELELEA